MSSLNTNIAAMTALQTLNQTNKDMLEVQKRISTGLRVADASDNAAYWSIATTMKADNMAVSTVSDALGLGAATADVSVTAMNSALDTVSQIKTKLVAARAPGLDRVKIQSEITALQAQLQSISEAAVFSGQNWLSADATGPATRSIVSSFSRDSTGAISIGTITVSIVGTDGTLLFDTSGGGGGILDQQRTTPTAGTNYTVADLDISALTDSPADLQDLEEMIQGVDDAYSQMTRAATFLGASKSRIDLQKDFVSKLMNSIDIGIGQLVDANMDEESTKLQALQVRQQLGVQALGIANTSAQQILKLFQ